MLELARESAQRRPLEAPEAGAAFAGVGAALPEQVVRSAEVAGRLGVAEDWIETRTGVRERRVAAPGELMTDFAARAGERALAAAGVGAEAVDLLLLATTSHHELIPNGAPRVAAQLGAHAAAALDVGAACTGFLAALALACAQIESGRSTGALVIGADVLSRHVDPLDRSTAALFGDGAGAAVLLPSRPGRIGPAILRADGTGADLIRAPLSRPVIAMRGPDTFRQAVDRLSEATLDAVALAGTSLEAIDLFVYHQANARILRAVGERLGLPPERVPAYVTRYGNTSAASIPIALVDAEAEGLLRPGARVLLAAFGAGLTWGAAVCEWGAPSDA
ncbi:MAG: beta-ketoacyl-ACP synthase 3 [Thermoleophilaceae bacterium]|nr:beta-ketoacyl-ACP synthase 3 [Thermoleophilaceae bacterium]